MVGGTLVAGVVLVASAIYPADCAMTYHVAFLRREPPSGGSVSSIGGLQYQGSADVPTVKSEFDDCKWTNYTQAGTTHIKYLQATGEDCDKLVPRAVGLANSGFKVETADDIILHVFQTDSSGDQSDGFLAIPDNHLGNEYYVITYCSLGGYCQFAVAGTVDGTSVNIVFPNGTSTGSVTCNGEHLPDSAPSGEPVPFTLDEFRVLYIESEADLSGTYIFSDHNIAVFVGARNVPDADNSNRSCMIEQIPPVNKWGNEFVVAPNTLNEAGDVIKILTKNDNTWVHILGFSPFIIQNKGEWTEHRIDWGMHSSITTSKPVLIVQVMSVNLYNDTTAVTGRPAMVLVPHVQQWINTSVYTDCLLRSENESVVTTIAERGNQVVWNPSANHITASSTEEIGGTDYSVLTVRPNPAGADMEIQQGVAGTNRAAYGYCDGKYAILLDAKWEWENEECELSIPVPGDGVDNNCNGQIDEENCTESDLAVSFNSTQHEASGTINFKSIHVKGRESITFTVQSCDIAVVTLRTSTEPVKSYTAHIMPGNVTLQVCVPECKEAKTVATNTATECTDLQEYTIGWHKDDNINTTRHSFETEASVAVIDETIDYDVMIVSAFVGTAIFKIDLQEKDCNKIISKEADTLGKVFVVNVGLPDVWYHWVHITNTNEDTVNITIYNKDDESEHLQVMASTTKEIKKEDVKDLSPYNRLIIEATDEISVFVMRQLMSNSHVFGYPVLPVDVLGPTYHLFLETSNDANPICTVHTITDEALTNLQEDPIDDSFNITEAIYSNELRNQHLLESNRPVAVFCGTGGYMAQMPPLETLGTQHYIPRLNLTAMEAKAELHLVATEDSTVVIIRGNYDQLDTVKLTGKTHTRDVETNMVYNISATKPIQVHIRFRPTDDDYRWASVVVVPPVEQYKEKHVLPKFTDFAGHVIFSNAVNESGDEVSSQISDDARYPIGNIPQVFMYGSPTYSLTVINHTDNRYILLPSDVMYKDINKVCKITAGSPGDGIDNDCDGLIDEEQCSDDPKDVDIDGNLNVDCAINTSASPAPINLSLASVSATCTPTDHDPAGEAGQNGGEADSNNSDITINNGAQFDITNVPPAPDNDETAGSEAIYGHLESTKTSSFIIPTTTPAPGSTVATVETCVADCLCPCSWVEPAKNYTPQELQAKVAEIQEKLKITKTTLSASIRSKTSAPDSRTEATAVGYVGICFLVTMIGAIVVLDIPTIIRDVKMLIGNLREVFQP